MLQLRNAPRRSRENLLMAGTDQQQIRQHRDAKGLLDASLLCTDLVFTQSQVGLEFPIDLLHGPSSLVCTYHLSRDPLVQIGHQDFCIFRADVTPSFTQNHRDVTDVPQTQACAIHPEDFAALGAREAGHPSTLIICAWQMGHQVFDGLILDRFPRPSNGEDKAPLTSRIVGVALHDHLHIVLRAIGCIALDDNPFRPGRRAKVPDHLTKQRIFRLIRWMGFRADQTKSDWEAIDIPVDDQQGKTNPEKPGVMFTFTSFLGQWIPRTSLRLFTAITHEKEGAIFGRWQGVQGFLAPPFYQHMDIPVGRFKHTTKAPGGHLGRGPVGKLFQSFPPWEERLHDHEPTEDETVTMSPNAGHTTKEDSDEKRQIGNRNHSRSRRAKGVS